MRVLLHYAWLHVAQRLADEMRACYATWDPSNDTKSRLTNPKMQNTAMRACEASGTSDDGSDGGGRGKVGEEPALGMAAELLLRVGPCQDGIPDGLQSVAKAHVCCIISLFPSN